MIQTFMQLAQLLTPFRKRFWAYVLLIACYEAAQVANSYVLPAAVRLQQSGISAGTWVLFFAGLEMFDLAFRFHDHFTDWHIVSRLLFPIQKHLNGMIIRVFLGQDAAWHQRNNSGVLIGKAENGKHKIEEMCDMLAWDFLPTTMQSLLTVPFLIYFSPLAAGIVLGSLGLFVFITHKSEQFRLPLRKMRHDLYETLWQKTEEEVKAHETVTIYGQTARITREHETINDEIVRLGLKETRKIIFFYHELRAALIQHTGRLVLLILMYQLTHGAISIPGVFFVYTLSERLLAAFWRFSRMMQRVGECSEGISRLHDLSKQRPAIVDGPTVRRDIAVSENLTVTFADVGFSYPDSGQQAICNLSLKVHNGQEVAIVGPSGSGKTTLRRLLLRLFEISEGTIAIGGIPITEWPLEQLRSLFAYVPQGDEVFIFDTSILENIRFSRPEATNREVEEAARLAGLQQFILSLPQGFATRVGEKGMKLSGGQKQRIALARAVVSNRRFLILDEATSSVDALTEREMERGLREVFQNMTAIVIAHRMSTVWGADNIVVMDGGKKIAEGTHADLMSEEGSLYRQMVMLQTSRQL